MVYEKQTWADGSEGETPLSAERLNHMEDGIEAAHEGGGGIGVGARPLFRGEWFDHVPDEEEPINEGELVSHIEDGLATLWMALVDGTDEEPPTAPESWREVTEVIDFTSYDLDPNDFGFPFAGAIEVVTLSGDHPDGGFYTITTDLGDLVINVGDDKDAIALKWAELAGVDDFRVAIKTFSDEIPIWRAWGVGQEDDVPLYLGESPLPVDTSTLTGSGTYQASFSVFGPGETKGIPAALGSTCTWVRRDADGDSEDDGEERGIATVFTKGNLGWREALVPGFDAVKYLNLSNDETTTYCVVSPHYEMGGVQMIDGSSENLDITFRVGDRYQDANVQAVTLTFMVRLYDDPSTVQWSAPDSNGIIWSGEPVTVLPPGYNFFTVLMIEGYWFIFPVASGLSIP